MILDDIVRDKRRDLQHLKAAVPLAELQQRPLFHVARRNFVAALRSPRRAVIAEVKKASPSKGEICADFNPVAIAIAYAEGGAAAISVLTEEHYFQGRLEDLAAVRRAVALPLLRKDFIVDPYQLYEARAYGADAVLLIVAILSDEELQKLQWLAEELNLATLVEVHDAAELARAAHAHAPLIGINNRDLRTFQTTLATTEALAPSVPHGALIVAESGIGTVDDIERLERVGVSAFLIGETLMRSTDPHKTLAELVHDHGA